MKTCKQLFFTTFHPKQMNTAKNLFEHIINTWVVDRKHIWFEVKIRVGGGGVGNVVSFSSKRTEFFIREKKIDIQGVQGSRYYCTEPILAACFLIFPFNVI